MTMTTVYVLRTEDRVTKQPAIGVFEELQAGQARMGWSWDDKLDLRVIQEKRERGEPLDEEQKEAVRSLNFLRYTNPGDYIIYPHQPKRGQFSVVKVTGEYDYSDATDGLKNDFRSFRPCSLETPSPVDMYDKIVPSALRTRLGGQGRFSEVCDSSDLFFSFLKELHEAGQLQDGSISARIKRIYKKLIKPLPEMLRGEFNRQELSRKLCGELFERMGYPPENIRLQEGPSEAGSDLVVTVSSPLLPNHRNFGFRVGVQVFAYKDDVAKESLKTKLEQLLEGWETNALYSGVLLTTGKCTDEARALIDKHNEDNPDRLVRLIEGDELAELFLQHYPPESQ